MSTKDHIICATGVLIMLFFASRIWGLWDGLTGSPKISWYRRRFWRRTLKDLMSDLKSGRRSEISGEEIELALAYERRRLPSDLKFPKAGEVYESLLDVEIEYLTAHCAPFTGGGRAVLPKGERVRVGEVSDPKPLGAYCTPLNYEALHSLVVPANEQAHERYEGYYLSIDTIALNRCFKLVEGPAT